MRPPVHNQGDPLRMIPRIGGEPERQKIGSRKLTSPPGTAAWDADGERAASVFSSWDVIRRNRAFGPLAYRQLRPDTIANVSVEDQSW